MKSPIERLMNAASYIALSARAPGDACNPGVLQFQTLYTAYLPLLRTIAVRKFDVPLLDADALVQEIFAIYVLIKKEIDDPHGYLIGSICDAARRYHQDADAASTLSCGVVPCAATPEDELIDQVAHRLLCAAVLSRLDDNCRETLRRFYLRGETVAGEAHRLLHHCQHRAQAIYEEMMRAERWTM